ncbi:uncharacterized protein CcaverHIS019_0301240 [Cutaneotrichosporon cavernicola]|uniref:Uncharacterized protein n=1 Tax=Cutaneotrichosporon cavernicola TaxID=279322 RepID=A0AA48I2K8_9TREE|nr:uncharacterized protein CcaverHIS019_0301240 [Cutaneotrichosporon cavernicola]BEI90054.1 hypothetical protein CcaverHIS019_0301240 [Cutaneotrichosporon cavernicola]
MRFLIPLALLALVGAQDTTSSATDPSSSDSDSPAPAPTDSGNDGFTAPAEQDPNLPWNITYFIVPTRNNYFASGTSTWTGKIQGYNPGNNFMLQLTAAGNPDQKFAQSQGFWIKPNGTAMPQQVAGVPPSTPLTNAGTPAGAPGAPGSPLPDGTSSDQQVPNVPNAVPGATSAASTVSVAGGLLLVAAGLALWL